jgi:hypothetical protein
MHRWQERLFGAVPYETVLPGADADGSARERSLAVEVGRDVADDRVPAGPLTVPIHLHDKASYTFEIPLRIDRVVRGAHTTLATLDDDPELSIREFDPNLRNNSARIVVN